jgi:hypothetical protein
MVGTEKFPELKVLEDGVLPKEKDEYNCGIGLVAAIGIILRDLLGRSTVSEITRYNKVFDHSSMHVEKSSTEVVEESPEEYVCCFPRGTFQSLPTTSELGFRTYLHPLKAQWFTLFDCYADLQYDILLKRRDNNYVVDPVYVSLKGQLEDYAWPKHPPGAGDEKEGAASEQGADQVASLGADGGADQVASPDPGADGGVDQGADQEASPDPGVDQGADHDQVAPLGADQIASLDPGAADEGVELAADQVASQDPGADGGADQVSITGTPCDEFSDEDTEEEVSASFPPARKVWKGVPAKREVSIF